MQFDILGKVNKINLPLDNALDPLYEAIINSIDAIKDKNGKNGKIEITIERRDDQQQVNFESKEKRFKDIVGFTIKDNGIGFNEKNYNSFNTAETRHKVEIGGKGVGRFLWLKAFDHVEIKSTFLENGVYLE